VATNLDISPSFVKPISSRRVGVQAKQILHLLRAPSHERG
jgi:hypothetical protein